MTSGGIRGLVAQSMTAKKAGPRFIVSGTGPSYNFPSVGTGTYTFVAPITGKWKFVGWGPGGGGSGGSKGGSSGAYVEITKHLTKGQSVTVVVSYGNDTVFTFPDGSTATAGKAAGSGGAPGTATGGDVNLSGTAAVSSGNGNPGGGTGGGQGGQITSGFIGGAGAPANLPFRGGDGQGQAYPGGPGGGAIDTGNGNQGYALAVYIPR